MTDTKPELPSREVLDTWHVPELPDDFADRVADAWAVESRAAPVAPVARPGAWRGFAIAGVVGALAAALILAMLRSAPVPPPHIETPDGDAAPAVTAPPNGTGAAAATEDKVGLSVFVTPGGARVQIDGQEIAADPTGSQHVAAVLPGSHEMAITREGSLTIRETLDVPRRGLTLNRTMFSSKVKLMVDVTPDSARVVVLDGDRTIAELDGDALLLVPREAQSRYVVRASAQGYRDGSAEVDIEGDEARVQLQLTRSASADDPGTPKSSRKHAAKTAVLRIGHKRGVKVARVSVDGVAIGSTPISSYKVTPGRHKVVWRWDDGRVLSETVVVDEGEVRTLKRG